MTKRKETPDILAEIMGGEPPSLAELPAVPAPPTARPAAPPARKAEAKPKPVRKTPPVVEAPAPREMEYLLVSFQYYHGWRPRFHNGAELDDWLRGPSVHAYLQQLAAQGWELAAATSGERMYATADTLQLYFRRPKS
jgi:hypothetical protein